MLYRLGLVLLLLNLIPLLTSLPCVADEADEDFRLAAEMYRRQKWQTAAETFLRFLEDHPRHGKVPVAQLYLGLSQHNMEDYRAARNSLETYLKRFENHSGAADARFRLGECSFYLGELDRAEGELRAYLDLHAAHEMNDWAMLLIGDILVARQDWNSAADHWQSMLEGSPDPRLVPDVRYGLARSLEGLNKRREAFLIFRDLSETAHDELAARSLARMGHIYFNSKDYSGAARAYEAIVTRFPGSPDTSLARMNAGLARFEAANFSEALTHLEEAVKNRQFAFRGGLLIAKCHQNLKEIDAARAAFQETLQLNPDNAAAARVMFEWAQMERLEDNADAAIQLFSDLADRYPESSDAMESLLLAADLLLDAGRPNDAARLVTRVRLESETNEELFKSVLLPQIDILEGRTQLALENATDAIPLLKAALAADGISDMQGAVARYHLVRALHQAGNSEEAIAEADPLLTRIREGNQTDLSQVFVIAADSHLNNGDYEDAEALATEYLELSTDSPGSPTRLDAWATRFKADALQNQFDTILALLPEFKSEFQDDSRYARILLAAGEVAWKNEQPAKAIQFFQDVAALPPSTPERPQALSGVAWSEFDSGNAKEAIAATTRFMDDYPDDPRRHEIRYLRGLAQSQLQEFETAAKTLESLFDDLTAGAEFVAGDEEKTPTKYAFEGAKLSARFYANADLPEDANRMWQKVTEHFQAASTDDALLFEWAGANAAQERFARADKIYQLLLERHPGSQFADSARLALAESDWIAGRAKQARDVLTSLADQTQTDPDVREKAMFHLITMMAESEAWADAGSLAEEYLSLFDAGERKHAVRLLRARAHVEAGELEEADSLLGEMIEQTADGTITDAPWTDEIWIVAAETALAQKNYNRIDQLERELAERRDDSPVMYKMKRVQGRRWKSQAPPDFEKARQALREVTTDPHGRGTEDAAKAQFLIAETYLLQDNPREAFREYYRVHVNYQFPEMQAMALYQAGGCEQATQDYQSAIQTYSELLDTFSSAPADLRANTLLRMAECSAAQGKPDAAKTYYQRVQSDFGGSAQATEAAAQLRKLES